MTTTVYRKNRKDAKKVRQFNCIHGAYAAAPVLEPSITKRCKMFFKSGDDEAFAFGGDRVSFGFELTLQERNAAGVFPI